METRQRAAEACTEVLQEEDGNLKALFRPEVLWLRVLELKVFLRGFEG